MKVIGKITKSMDMENIFKIIKMFTQDNGKMIKFKEKENLFGQMEITMMDNG